MPHGRLGLRISATLNGVPHSKNKPTDVSSWQQNWLPQALKPLPRYRLITPVCAGASRGCPSLAPHSAVRGLRVTVALQAPRLVLPAILSPILSATLKVRSLSVPNFVARRGDHAPQARLRVALPLGNTWSRTCLSANHHLARYGRLKREVRGGTGS